MPHRASPRGRCPLLFLERVFRSLHPIGGSPSYKLAIYASSLLWAIGLVSILKTGWFLLFMKHWQAVTTHGDIVTMTFLRHQDAKGVVSVSGERHPTAGASGTAWATVSWCLPALKAPLFLCSPSLPALDWQLPSHSGPYELRIEVQPKSHHRAHYETEGSRGAVKASAGGHPVVQVWRRAGMASAVACQKPVPWHFSV